MKYLIATVVFFMVSCFVFRYWLDTKVVIAKNCGHTKTIWITKVGRQGMSDIQEDGSDGACYATWEGKQSKFWNVGDCDDPTPVPVLYPDYSCSGLLLD